MKQLILASSSPRRQQLLNLLQLDFRIEPSSYEEVMDPSIPAEKLVEKLAYGKANAVAKKHTGAIVIGADSFVVLNKMYFGKPKDKKQAKYMLKMLSNSYHQIISGLAVIDTDTQKTIIKSCKLKVWVKKLTEQEIDSYIATGEPMDKAGAYAIQGLGSIIIEKIEGDFMGGIGLSAFQLAEALKEFGINVLD